MNEPKEIPSNCSPRTPLLGLMLLMCMLCRVDHGAAFTSPGTIGVKPLVFSSLSGPKPRTSTSSHMSPFNDESLDYDDDDFGGDDDKDEDDGDAQLFGQEVTKEQQQGRDLSGCSARQFQLFYEVILTGVEGFWVPRREESGPIVRIYEGELYGKLGSVARSRGLDTRVMIKEFSGEGAIQLAKSELESLAQMQSALCADLDEGAKNGEWLSAATTRHVMRRVNSSTKDDDEALLKWMEHLSTKGAPFVGVLGELNMEEFINEEEGHDARLNEIYHRTFRILKVPLPKPGSVWLVYEYVGVTTLGDFSQPALKMSALPGGNVITPSALPQWRDRVRYVKAIMKKCLENLSFLHENGITHQDPLRKTFILSSVGQDKEEALSPLTTVPSRSRFKVSNFCLLGRINDVSSNEEFRNRARAFKLDIVDGASMLESKSFAIAEDLSALAFMFSALMISSLAEIPSQEFIIPPLDDISLQRLVCTFDEDSMDDFCDYCKNVWSNSVVRLLDEDDGWRFLEEMVFARENVVGNLKAGQILTAEGVLSSPFFNAQE